MFKNMYKFCKFEIPAPKAGALAKLSYIPNYFSVFGKDFLTTTGSSFLISTDSTGGGFSLAIFFSLFAICFN